MRLLHMYQCQYNYNKFLLPTLYLYIYVTDTKKLREADKKSREYSEDPPRPPQETTPPPEQQQQQPPPDQPPAASTPSSNNIQSRAVVEEDDHFGQLSFSLGTPEYPEELTLSDESFGVHINSYSTTMVTFYVPCKIMHAYYRGTSDNELPQQRKPLSNECVYTNCILLYISIQKTSEFPIFHYLEVSLYVYVCVGCEL